MKNAKPKAFVPQYLRDSNNSQHTYYHRYRNIRGLWFLERLVRYYRKKQDTWAEDIVQVKHFGKDARSTELYYGKTGNDSCVRLLTTGPVSDERFKQLVLIVCMVLDAPRGGMLHLTELIEELADRAACYNLHLRLATKWVYAVITPDGHYSYPKADILRGIELQNE